MAQDRHAASTVENRNAYSFGGENWRNHMRQENNTEIDCK